MTAYSAFADINPTGGGTPTVAQSIALQNNSEFHLKIVKVDYFLSYGSGDPQTRFFRYEESSISGGTLWPPQPLRQGSLPSGVVCRGRLVTSTAGPTYVQGSAVTVTGTRVPIDISTEINAKASFQPPYDITIAPGSAFYVTSAFANATGTTSYFSNLVVYYEEERLPRST